MRNAIVGLVAAAILAGGWMMWDRGQANEPMLVQKKDAPKPDKKKVKELMTLKLEHHQKLLAALVMNDLPNAAKHAADLQKVRQDVAWMIVKTPQYEIWSKEFTSSADKVIKAATEKNPDAAKLGYLEMSLSCFNCHTYVRDLGDIRLEGFQP